MVHCIPVLPPSPLLCHSPRPGPKPAGTELVAGVLLVVVRPLCGGHGAGARAGGVGGCGEEMKKRKGTANSGKHRGSGGDRRVAET